MGKVQASEFDNVDMFYLLLGAFVDDLREFRDEAVFTSCFIKYVDLVNFEYRRF